MNRTKKLPVLLFFIFHISFSIGAQTVDVSQIPDLIPPSPEATAAFKFVETPVSLYTGMADVSVPLHQIDLKEMQIAVQLNYHSRGVKVEEMASSVGIGWSLSAGGAVSRQIRGKADDGPLGYLTEGHYATFFTDPDTRTYVYNMIVNHGLDMDPDLFFFNFNGYSGKFFFNHQTGEPVLQSFQDLKISTTWSGGRIVGFNIVDENGNTYFFGSTPGSSANPVADSEESDDFKFSNSIPTPLNNPDVQNLNTWHLIKMETYFGEVVEFNYTPQEPEYVRRSYDVKDYSNEGASSFYSLVRSNQYHLTEINYPGGRISFTYGTLRKDLKNARALDKVQVFSKAGVPQSEELIKGFKLSYTFPKSPSDANQLYQLKALDSTSNYRMFLNAVRQGKEGDSIPPYLFQYSSVTLPNRFSNSQDIWGYYNGGDNGAFLTFFDYGPGVDRSVNVEKAEAGLLKEMTLPSGGSTSFHYEQNRGVKPDFMEGMLIPGSEPLQRESVWLTKLDRDLYNELTREYTTSFQIGQNKVGQVQSSIEFSEPGCVLGTNTVNCRFHVSLHGPSGSYSLTYGDQNLSIPSGNYTLKVKALDNQVPENFEDSFIVKLVWNEEADLTDATGQKVMFTGGKRIKRIDYKNETGLAQTKNYTYEKPDGGESGKIFGLPNFYSIESVEAGFIVLKPYGSVPGSPLTSLQGNEIGYSNVTEFYGDLNSNNGKVEHTFTTFMDGGESYEFPYHPPIDNEWLRGKNLLTEYYKKAGGGYQKIKSITNKYVYAGQMNILDSPGTLAIGPFAPTEVYYEYESTPTQAILPFALFYEDSFPGYKTYFQMAGTAHLHSTIVTEYSSQGAFQTTSEFNYNYPVHYQVSSKSSLDSKGNTSRSRFFYPDEITSGNPQGFESVLLPVINNLKKFNSHRVATPLKVESSLENGQGNLSKTMQRTIVKEISGLILPFKIETYKEGDIFEERLTYHTYDEDGNPTQISRKEGPSTFLIWGYEGKFPIVKIENAVQSDIPSSMISLLKNLAAQDNDRTIGQFGKEGALREAFDDLRALPALSNALISTYTYDPLVGLTSTTDAKGLVTYFDYDYMNRLVTIKDENANVLKEYKYYHKNQ